MAMPQCCYLAKGAKRPSHTTNTIKFDRIPFDPCNSIKRFDLCPFDENLPIYSHPNERIRACGVELLLARDGRARMFDNAKANSSSQSFAGKFFHLIAVKPSSIGCRYNVLLVHCQMDGKALSSICQYSNCLERF